MLIERIRIDQINFGHRSRKDIGDLKKLAASIKDHGLLHPIVVARVNGGYELVVGARRLLASRDVLGESMIYAKVVTLAKDVNKLLMERDENDCRKDFTASEKVAIGKAIETALGERRGGDHKNNGKTDEKQSGQMPGLLQPKGVETRALAAEAAGFTSSDTYERAKHVVEEGAPELVKAMDEGIVSVSDAAAVADEPKATQKKAVEAVKSGKAKTAKAAVPKKPKPGKPLFDDRTIDTLIGKLIRAIDDRGSALGKSKQYHECVEAMGVVANKWKRWSKEST